MSSFLPPNGSQKGAVTTKPPRPRSEAQSRMAETKRKTDVLWLWFSIAIPIVALANSLVSTGIDVAASVGSIFGVSLSPEYLISAAIAPFSVRTISQGGSQFLHVYRIRDQ